MRRSVAHTNLVELAAPVFVRSGGPEREDSWNNELLAAYLIQRPASPGPGAAAEKESVGLDLEGAMGATSWPRAPPLGLLALASGAAFV